MIWRLFHVDPACASAAKSTWEPSEVKPYGSRSPFDCRLFLLASDGVPFDHLRSATFSRQAPKGRPHFHCSLQTTRVPVLSNRGQINAPACEVRAFVSRQAREP